MNFDSTFFTETPNNIAIKAQNIVKNFYQADKEIKVLQGINFVLNKKDSFAITGASGAGKSTLLHILSTLMQPSFGSIQIGSVKVDYNKSKDLEQLRRNNLGIVFQFHYLLEDFSVLENVLLPLQIQSFYRDKTKTKADQKRAKDLLAYLGLEHRLHFYPKDLSGGEKQRVAVARALIHEPDILFADEPTGNLDEKNSAKLQQLLFKLQKDLGLSLVIVTHDINFAIECDQNLSMKAGYWDTF